MDIHALVLKELSNSKYLGRSHGTRGTYNDGCRGPLCRKANRDYGRERLNSPTSRRASAAIDRDKILEMIVAEMENPSAQSA